MDVMKFQTEQTLKAQSARAEQERLAQQKQSEDLLKALLKAQTRRTYGYGRGEMQGTS